MDSKVKHKGHKEQIINSIYLCPLGILSVLCG